MFKNIYLVCFICFSCVFLNVHGIGDDSGELLQKNYSRKSCETLIGRDPFKINKGEYVLIKTTPILNQNVNCTNVIINLMNKNKTSLVVTFDMTLEKISESRNISQHDSQDHFKSGAKLGNHIVKLVDADQDFLAICAYSMNPKNPASYGFVLTQNKTYSEDALNKFVVKLNTTEIQNNNTISVTQGKTCPNSATIQAPALLASFISIYLIFQQYL